MNPLTHSKNSTILPLLIPLALALVWLVLSPTVQAVLPPPDGGYPGANTAEGTDALFSLISGGTFNTALGFQALYSNTTGVANTATGASALHSNTSGNGNTATGAQALENNTTGLDNTANGFLALSSNTTGAGNTASGFQALYSNATGSENTASGHNALFSNTTGSNNTANGVNALFSNTTGLDNTAIGFQALESNTGGGHNTAIGFHTLFSNVGVGLFGGGNTAMGDRALEDNTTGSFNTAIGVNALSNNTTGNSNIALGLQAGELTTGDNNIDIGNRGVAAEANTIRIGTQRIQTATFIAGISGTPIGGGGSTVRVDANGQLGTAPSSARFKQNIKPMDKASEALHALKPVTFRYKEDLDPEGIPQFGLVAEEVEKVNPDLVSRDEQGKAFTVRYEAVNAMLLNEFLKEHRKVEALQASFAQQQKDFQATVAQQQKQIEALSEGLQKVSAQVQMSKPAPQTVADNH